MRLVLIGQAPSARACAENPGKAIPALEGRCGRKLADLMGLTFGQYLERTERMNLLPDARKTNAKGDSFDFQEGKRSAARIGPTLKGKRVLFLGKKVARSFGLNVREPLFWWKWDQDLKCVRAVFPHPSGVNRTWNDPETARIAAYFLRETGMTEAS